MRAHQTRRHQIRKDISEEEEDDQYSSFSYNTYSDYSYPMSQRDAYDTPPPLIYDFFPEPSNRFNLFHLERNNNNIFEERQNKFISNQKQVHQHDQKRDMSIEQYQQNNEPQSNNQQFKFFKQYDQVHQISEKGKHQLKQEVQFISRQQQEEDDDEEEDNYLHYRKENKENIKENSNHNVEYETPCAVSKKRMRKRVVESTPKANSDQSGKSDADHLRRVRNQDDLDIIFKKFSSKKRQARRSVASLKSSNNNATSGQLHTKFQKQLNMNYEQNEQAHKLKKLVKNKRKSEVHDSQYSRDYGSLSGKTCAVCLSVPEDNVYGLIQCKHEFCWDCIKSWSDVTNQCPMCRQPFTQITKKNFNDSDDTQVIHVEQKKQRIQDDDEFYWEENSFVDDYDIDELCYICETDQDEDKLIICDHCGVRICHTYCDDQLFDDEIPEEDWFCHECRVRSELFE